MMFTRTDWVQETLHQLQHFDVVQMFSTYSDLGPKHKAAAYPSFTSSVTNDRNRNWLESPESLYVITALWTATAVDSRRRFARRSLSSMLSADAPMTL